MVLTKPELIAALQNEVRILLHLASKIDRAKLDYRPTPKQRSTIELLRYLSVMGPRWLQFAKAGAFDSATWTAADHAAEARDFDQALAAIATHTDAYAALLADVSDADLRAEIDGGGPRPLAERSWLTTYSVNARSTACSCSYTSRPAVARS